jgi:hypothetical protein
MLICNLSASSPRSRWPQRSSIQAVSSALVVPAATRGGGLAFRCLPQALTRTRADPVSIRWTFPWAVIARCSSLWRPHEARR